jgi:anti-anti-sigma factor
MNETISANLKNQFAEIGRLHQIVTEMGERHHVSPKDTFAVNLSLEEIVANVISYGHDDSDDHDIVVRLALADGQWTIEVEDDGRPFDPLDVPTPDLAQPLEERSVGGLGIHLVRNMMDGMEYRRDGGKNRLVMKKRIAEQGGAMLEVTHEKLGGIVAVRIKGRLDVGSAKRLEDHLQALMNEGENRLVVDFSELDYISSSGLHVLLLAAIRAKDARGGVALCGMRDHIRAVFDIAGFSHVFPIYGSQDEALGGFR